LRRSLRSALRPSVRLRLLSLLLLSAILAPSVASGIVIRHDIADAAYLAKESDFPALFAIYRTKSGHKECVATVISARWAITAAHCAREKQLLEAVAPNGQGFSVEVAGKSFLIDQVIAHPGTGTGRAPDIAVLRFAVAVTHVAPIPLYKGRDEAGCVILMPGWGGTGNGKTGLGVEDGLFRAAENMVDRAEDGRLAWMFDAPGPNSKALTLEGISGPGDSGGPALIKTTQGWALAGVSSAQNTMGRPEGLYGVEELFVRVSEFTEWIERHYLSGRAPRSS